LKSGIFLNFNYLKLLRIEKSDTINIIYFFIHQ
jgi:hypothetical protein